MSTHTIDTRVSREPWAARLAWLVPTLVCSFTVVALVVRLFNYRETIFGDEFYAWAEMNLAPSLWDVPSVIHDSIEVSPPLYFMFAWLARQVATAPEAIRIPSLVAGTLIVPAGFVLGRRVAGQWVGVVAAALMALSPFAIYYGGEGRPYGIVILLGALTPLALLWALDGRSAWRWALFSVACAAGFYTHLTTIFMVGGCLIWALATHTERWRAILVSAAGTLLIYLPWAGYVSGKRSLVMYGSTWGRGFDWFWSGLSHATIGGAYVPIRLLPGIPIAAVMSACVLIGFATRIRRLPRPQSPTVLMGVIAFCVAFGLITYSTITNVNLMMTRNFSSGFAAMMVLAAVAVAGARPVRLAALLSAVLVGCFAIGAAMTGEVRFSRPDGKAAAQFLSPLYRPGMVLFSNDNRRYWAYVAPGVPEVINHMDQRKAWAAAKRTGAPVAFMLTRAPHYPAPANGDPRAEAGYVLACERKWSGLFPVGLWIFEPRGSRVQYPPSCTERPQVETIDPANMRRASILSWANGKRLLSQHEPLGPGDLVMPAVGAVIALGFGGWLIADRRHRRA